MTPSRIVHARSHGASCSSRKPIHKRSGVAAVDSVCQHARQRRSITSHRRRQFRSKSTESAAAIDVTTAVDDTCSLVDEDKVDGGVTLTEPTAILCGQVEGQENVAVRVHDACFTSEVLGSLKCDCAEQLTLALDMIQANPPGIVIYLQQEGRGIGLANKIAAYALQEKGLDTVDANRALGLPDDCREYTSVRNILTDLNVKSIRLMTNNPRKMNVLTHLGISITGRIPCVVQPGSYNQGYLKTKETRMEHLLDGSWCYWNHDGEPTQPTPTSLLKGGMGLPPGANGLTGVRAVPKVGAADGGKRGGENGSSSKSSEAAQAR